MVKEVSNKNTKNEILDAYYSLTEVDGEIKVYKQIVSNLESKVVALEEQIQHLNEKGDNATLQVQDIAIKSIECASRQCHVQEKSQESSKAINRLKIARSTFKIKKLRY